jgi:soluble lytic murein transglycosylase
MSLEERRLHALTRRTALLASAVLVASMGAHAQPSDSAGVTPAQPTTAPIVSAPSPARPYSATRLPLSDSDAIVLRQALDGAKRGDINTARAAIANLRDPVAVKTATWALIDANGESLSFFEVDRARKDLAGWPRAGNRQAAAERLLETSGKGPTQIIAWFETAEPQTAHGANALASAYRQTGQREKSTALIRRWWRTKSFEADIQRNILGRFGDVLTPDDHLRRADILLYGAQGPAARDMVALLPQEHQAPAQARIALRGGADSAGEILLGLTPSAAQSPGVAFEHAAFLRRKGQEAQALTKLANFPTEISTPDQAERIWDERHRLTLYALRNGDARAAYAAAANSGLTVGGDAADAEFYAGWIALTKLGDAVAAGRHFAAIEKIGSSSITRGRAYYWQGRAAEKRGDAAAAQAFYAQGAKHQTTFYGQLAAEKAGQSFTLPSDPQLTPEDRARFEGLETVRAARLLFELGYKDLFRGMALHLDDTVTTLPDAALLVDMVRGYGEQDTSMKVVRALAQRGLVLTGRGYPVRTPPPVNNAPEFALIMGITRQESGFDPVIRSGAGARGMMQLMPATAKVVARRMGVSYSPDQLDDPDYNMRLGSHFLGQLIDQFSGSYVMSIAGYNAGPGRPVQWSAFCGDPRGAADPIDFIECIPFSETRNYVMRVMEGAQVYRAKMSGGATPVTLSRDLKRGTWGYTVRVPTVSSATASTPAPSAAQ